MVVRVRRTAHGYGVGVKGTHLLLGAVVTVPFLLGAAAGVPDAADEVAFRFTDPDIVESSGLVAVDGLVVTTNDSGDSGRVFAVDPATGATVGVTRWATDPEDVEALAPAGPGHVWVADIGDNQHARAIGVGAPRAGRARRPRRRAGGLRARLPRRRARRRGAGQPPRDRPALPHLQGRLLRHGVRRPAAAARRPAQPPDRGRPGAGHRHGRHLPAGRGRGGHAHLHDGPPVGVPVVAGRRVVAAARPGPGRGHRPRGGRAAGQHRGSPLPGAPGRPAGVRRRDRPALARVDAACAGSRRRTACRCPLVEEVAERPSRSLRRGPRRARPGRAASCRGRPAARRRPA